jgi:formyl-CoA transferase
LDELTVAAIGDSSAGIYLSFGIVTALLEREETGEGQWVSTSLVQALIAMLDFQAARWVVAHEVPEQVGNDHPLYMPTGAFKTQDGYINIAGSGNLFPRLCKVLGMPELLTHPDFNDFKLRHKNRIALVKVIEEKTSKRTSSEWVEAFNKAGVPCGPIYSIDQVFGDPQVQHLGIAKSVKKKDKSTLAVVGQPVSLSRTGSRIAAPPPGLGEHTAQVLKEFGFSAKEIAALHKAKAI